MKTYQDLVAIGNDEQKRKAFVRALISEHELSDDYKIAHDAYEYYCHRNVTINEYQKLLYTVSGVAVPDNYSANYKMACRHFHRFIVQEVGHLLGNGISWNTDGTEEKLGKGKKSIDRQTLNAAKAALWARVAFGYWNNDHVEVFNYLEFVPLFDEMDGSLKAGVRYWRIDKSKPLKATLYELDGYTKYVYDTKENLDEPKQKYLKVVGVSEADGEEVYEEMNYPSFPIVPLWANDEHQSEIVGLREQIDCYDLIKSGFANTVDEASIVYWTIQNAGDMDDVDLAAFVNRMRTVHAASVDENGAKAESHQSEAPFQSRQALLETLDKDLYKDAMALDVERIASGAVTATQIKAAYEGLTAKCDDFEYQVLDFLEGIMALAGVDDEPSFTRSMLVNQTEMIQVLTQAAQYLPAEYITEKMLELLGDADKLEDVLKQIDEEDYDRFNDTEEEEPPAEPIEE